MFTNKLSINYLVKLNFSNAMSKKLLKRESVKNEKKKDNQEITFISLDKSDNILISVLAKPGSKQNAITGITEEGVNVQISAPPSDGEANTELVKYIASVLGLRKSDVILNKGLKSRNKILKITGKLSIEEVNNLIQKEIGE